MPKPLIPNLFHVEQRPNQAQPAGFTLVELLVVVTVIAALIAILLPTINTARTNARHTRASAHLKHLATGYATRTSEHRGQFLYGYTPPTLFGKPVTIQTDTGHTLGLPVADRYPWRLAPYVPGIWPILYEHTHQRPPEPLPHEDPASASAKAYSLSVTPGFGINSCYLGGHHGLWEGFRPANGSHVPNRGKHVIFNDTEANRPATLIVFAESQARNAPGLAPDAGIHFLSPPHARGPKWSVQPNQTFELAQQAQIVGLPMGRYGPRTATAMLDGHVSSLTPPELADMRRWANQAQHPTWDFRP